LTTDFTDGTDGKGHRPEMGEGRGEMGRDYETTGPRDYRTTGLRDYRKRKEGKEARRWTAEYAKYAEVFHFSAYSAYFAV